MLKIDLLMISNLSGSFYSSIKLTSVKKSPKMATV